MYTIMFIAVFAGIVVGIAATFLIVAVATLVAAVAVAVACCCCGY